MDKDQQRIAIAEVCGWRDTSNTNYGRFAAIPSRYKDSNGRIHFPVDYLNDLNAMHEATMSQSARPSFWQPFHQFLWHAVERDRKANGAGLTTPVDVACATAAQRAEAFLKTLNLWIEQ